MTTGANRVGIEADTNRSVSISIETLVYALVVIGAVAIRWINLGAAPLTVGEAPQAMAAWHMVAPTSAPGAGAIDSILVLAGAIASFAVWGPGNAAARLIAAFGGTAAVSARALCLPASR